MAYTLLISVLEIVNLSFYCKGGNLFAEVGIQWSTVIFTYDMSHKLIPLVLALKGHIFLILKNIIILQKWS